MKSFFNRLRALEVHKRETERERVKNKFKNSRRGRVYSRDNPGWKSSKIAQIIIYAQYYMRRLGEEERDYSRE